MENSSERKRILEEDENKYKDKYINCVYCGKRFFAKYNGGPHYRKYCSKSCRDRQLQFEYDVRREWIKSEKDIPLFNVCAWCGKKVKRRISTTKIRKNNFYCSKECKNNFINLKAQKKAKEKFKYFHNIPDKKICPGCKKVFYKNESNNRGWVNKIYCSTSCYRKHKWKLEKEALNDYVPDKKICPGCKKVFYKNESNNLGWKKRIYCSTQCYSKFRWRMKKNE